MAAIREALVPMDNDHRNEDAFTRVESTEIRLEQGPINRIVTPVSESVGLICGVGMLAMVLMMSYEVIARYVFNAPTSWVTEYSLYVFVATSFLGTAYAQLSDSHIRVEILLDTLKPLRRHQFELVSAWLGFLFAIVASSQMGSFVWSEYVGGSRAWGLLTTPLWIPQTPVAVGIAVFAFSILGEVRRLTPSIGRTAEWTGLAIFLFMAGSLVALGGNPGRILGTPLDWGTATIVLAVLIVSAIWNGYRIALSVAALMLGGGLLFHWMGAYPTLIQGALLAAYLMILMAMGVRIAIALGIVGSMGLLFLVPTPQLSAVSERIWSSVNSFAFTAIPMFILMGAFLLRSGVTSDLFNTMLKWLGRLPGGIAHATVGACGIFAAVSGSSLATAATMGMTACPEMIQRGYSPRLTYGVVAAGGTLGILIPPSIAMILYGSLVGESVGALFIAGVIPGLILILSFMIVVYVWSMLKTGAAPRGVSYSWGEKLSSLTNMLPFLLLIFGVLGSLYLGVATPTEAGAMGALIAGALCAIKKRMTLQVLRDSVLETVKVTSFLILIVAAASIMGYVFDYIRLPRTLVEVIKGVELAPWAIVATLVVCYVILGMFIEPISMMLMTLPVAFPMVTSVGLHPIWFGVVLVMMIEIGLITPPVGVILFILKGMYADVDFREIVYGVTPFVAALLFNILLLYLFPNLVMWLPTQMSSLH
jgi:tripartite ATP-independent transporter DctM subunit